MNKTIFQTPDIFGFKILMLWEPEGDYPVFSKRPMRRVEDNKLGERGMAYCFRPRKTSLILVKWRPL